MKLIFTICFLLVIANLFNNCENYVDSTEISGLFTTNNLDIKLKVLDDSDHKYEIKKITDKELASSYQLAINVKTKFSVLYPYERKDEYAWLFPIVKVE